MIDIVNIEKWGSMVHIMGLHSFFPTDHIVKGTLLLFFWLNVGTVE